MSFLASLSAEARAELRAFVDEAVDERLAARERADAQQEWVTTEEAGGMLGTTANAVRCRLQDGWLASDAVKDGSRWLVRRAAILAELDQRAGRL